MAQTELHRAIRRGWWGLVINGVLALMLGIFILARPLESVAAFALVIALWALMQGVVSIVHAVELRSIAPHWWVLLLNGVIGVGFGIAALYYYPGLSLTFAVVWTAWWLMLIGIVSIFIAMQERRVALPWGWTMAWGILTVAAGIFALMSPPLTLAALMGFLSAFGILSSLVLLVTAFRLRSAAEVVASVVGGARPA